MAPILRIALTDITQQKTALDQLEHLAFYDPLTDLPNRQLLKDRLRLAMAASARSRKYGALLFIDLDNFKTLNDTLGHNIGDLLLQQVAQRLLSSVRQKDTAARLGGDEFVVMLEDLSENAQEAAIHAEISGKKILAALNAPYLLRVCSVNHEAKLAKSAVGLRNAAGFKPARCQANLTADSSAASHLFLG
ncbi:MAG: GGDEF domain-containing protein, partial [Methylococcaceae bacterium]|nr:GGDEF domain-containing protein [Methylococcaceae bacterium]MDP3904734.1 GGDEF domain-containing protein [Methylococcaceae bacterium]